MRTGLRLETSKVIGKPRDLQVQPFQFAAKVSNPLLFLSFPRGFFEQ